jgi:hypothetical protein
MPLMSTSCHLPRVSALIFTPLVLCLLTARAAQTPAAAPAASVKHGPVATNASPAQPQAPKSVFVVPASPQDGRDPFFPQSIRQRPIIPQVTTNVPAVVVELELKGISGTADRRLAIINNGNFARGEEGDVQTNVGRVRITCKEITADSVQVVVNGQQRVLTLRSKL